jgi:Superinfection immunity protein
LRAEPIKGGGNAMDDIIGLLAMDDIIGLLLWVIMLGVYLIPTLVARSQEHHQLYAIGVLNLLLGWTLVGWIGALVWASKREEPLLNQKKNHHRKRNHHRKPPTQPQRPVAHSDLARRLAELRKV